MYTKHLQCPFELAAILAEVPLDIGDPHQSCSRVGITNKNLLTPT
jgi:hypothetical protein